MNACKAHSLHESPGVWGTGLGCTALWCQWAHLQSSIDPGRVPLKLWKLVGTRVYEFVAAGAYGMFTRRVLRNLCLHMMRHLPSRNGLYWMCPTNVWCGGM